MENKLTALNQLERTAERARADAAKGLAELARAVSDAVRDLDEAKQEKGNYVTEEELNAAISGAIARSY